MQAIRKRRHSFPRVRRSGRAASSDCTRRSGGLDRASLLALSPGIGRASQRRRRTTPASASLRRWTRRDVDEGSYAHTGKGSRNVSTAASAELLRVDRLSSFPPAPATEGDHRRGLEVQAALAAPGQHRARSLVDALVAAIAEARDLIVLHDDADFELVAGITGQAQEWIVPRGTPD
ncbi:MAG TPA: PIN domain-containing protein [Acidimicrobiales bacterium]|nr:PIN domain-containing protein [Acidimicrobiales bacterium]